MKASSFFFLGLILSFIFFNFIYHYYYFFLYNIVLVFTTHRNESTTGVPNPIPLSHLPPKTIRSDQPSAPDPSILHPTSNLGWKFISYIILSMFQCRSPKSSHHLHLPQSPKDDSIHLCLFCCLRVNDNRVIITIERVTGICVSILYWCFPFWLTSLCIIGSSFIHLIRTVSNVFFLMAE